jgi:hypothetical protein
MMAARVRRFVGDGELPMHIAVIDSGQPDEVIAWAMAGPRPAVGTNNLDACIDALARALTEGPLALGFKASTFVPMRLSHVCPGVCTAGPASSNRVIVPYVLSKLRSMVPAGIATLDMPISLPGRLLLFAFVTNQQKLHREGNVEEALKAVAAFQRHVNDPASESAIAHEGFETFSLLGAMLLRTGWTSNQSILRQPCLLVIA